MTDTAALLNGQAGIDAANQVFAGLPGPARFASGVALIETAADEGAVSPVRSLLSFAHRLTELDGDTSHSAAIGAEIAGLVMAGGLGAAAAMADFSAAVTASQLSRSEALSGMIAASANGSLAIQLEAGIRLAQIITRGGGEGGEGGGGGGGSLSVNTVIQTIHNAVIGGSLAEA